MTEEIFKKLKEIITEVSEINTNEIDYESKLIDLNFSSIEILSVVAEIQREYNITIDTDEMMTIETVKDLVELIEKEMA